VREFYIKAIETNKQTNKHNRAQMNFIFDHFRTKRRRKKREREKETMTEKSS
jgi:hypothetical protein